jgi:uncharacterized membrane protein YagU involved in acid resistance
MSQRHNKTREKPAWLKDALAGFIATIPMTLFMLGTQRFLPKGQRYDLPPELLTKELAHRAHVKSFLTKKQILSATLLSHFGYGAAMGALYRPLEKRMSLSAPVKGTLFGLLIWLTSYFGLTPLLGLSESGHREPARRNLMMLVAHVVWGSTLGIMATALASRNREVVPFTSEL